MYERLIFRCFQITTTALMYFCIIHVSYLHVMYIFVALGEWEETRNNGNNLKRSSNAKLFLNTEL